MAPSRVTDLMARIISSRKSKGISHLESISIPPLTPPVSTNAVARIISAWRNITKTGWLTKLEKISSITPALSRVLKVPSAVL